MSFSDFSSRLEKVIVLSEEIVKSCQSAKNHKKILEKFENKISEALKVLKFLRNYRDHFFNQENATLLERLINDIENIKIFVDYISQLEESSKSKMLISILKIKKLFEVRKFKKSFDNNLVNIQRSIESSKERDNNNETQDDDEIKDSRLKVKMVKTDFEKFFDNNLVNVQRSIESSKERDNNNETQDEDGKTLKMVKTDSFGAPMKNQTNTLINSETDEHGIKTITTTIITTRSRESKVPEVIIKKVKIS
ncbi:hypothetical protein RhiirA4_510795 [Rhizophagus irregularis]|uniref:Uncharacterized protein n=1 Tax=Rhizophagus irregularis TaxID=588596 RepID=A0A2I1FVJ5_9GLOM|nr:hypothetical protein RhiirA4_510795 [Rhizophagus irregularis]